MIIVNADDWGRSTAETDAALACYERSGITSVSAMVFMADSERAAELAVERCLDVGLHLNFDESFNAKNCPAALTRCQHKTKHYLRLNKYSQLVFNPLLRRHFADLYKGQVEEFMRLYGFPPSHIDGHRHMHLCANMLMSSFIPKGQKVRRSFSFWPGEKSFLNRAYRRLVDWRLDSLYLLADYFFALSQQLSYERFGRICRLALYANVELMTHPAVAGERAFLESDRYETAMKGVLRGTYADL